MTSNKQLAAQILKIAETLVIEKTSSSTLEARVTLELWFDVEGLSVNKDLWVNNTVKIMKILRGKFTTSLLDKIHNCVADEIDSIELNGKKVPATLNLVEVNTVSK